MSPLTLYLAEKESFTHQKHKNSHHKCGRQCDSICIKCLKAEPSSVEAAEGLESIKSSALSVSSCQHWKVKMHLEPQGTTFVQQPKAARTTFWPRHFICTNWQRCHFSAQHRVPYSITSALMWLRRLVPVVSPPFPDGFQAPDHTEASCVCSNLVGSHLERNWWDQQAGVILFKHRAFSNKSGFLSVEKLRVV